MSKIHTKTNAAAILLLFILSLSALSSPGTAGDEDFGLCELALAICWSSSFNPNNPTDFLNCVWGYSFCKEYVEPYLQ